MDMNWTAGDRVIQQQDAGNHVSLYHSAGDASVWYEVLDSLLLALRCHILNDFKPFVGDLEE